MPKNFFAIVANTFTETLRQPVYGVIIAATILLLIISPSLIMFTLDDDNQLLKDVGLSNLLVAGLLLGVFAAAAVLTEEIERKTTLTVLSKTVSRSVFIVGKFVGIAAAVIMAEYLLSLVLIMTVRHGVLQTARVKHDWVVITLGSASALVACIVGLVGNYFYRWHFSSVAVSLSTALATVVIAILSFIDPSWAYNPAENNLPWDLIPPIILIVLAVLVLTAVALVAAVRFNMTMTLIICVIVFISGIMMEHWLAPILRNASGIRWYLAWIPLTIIPNINFFVVTNAIYEKSTVPLSYIAQTGLYALLYVTACLLFAVALFRRREIG